MKNLCLFVLFVGFICTGFAQEIIELPHDNPANIAWKASEQEYYSAIWNTQVITNVSKPSMEVFRPAGVAANRTGVVIAPGGGLYAHSIKKEGTDVARWLNQKGITAFVLKYRLVPTGKDGVKEYSEIGDKIGEKIAPVLPLAIADGLSAVSYIREHARALGVEPDKIGFMGFSAGGAVTMGVAFNADANNNPNFLVPVYPWMTILGEYEVPEEAPPLAIVCASNDNFLFVQESVKLYSAWQDEGNNSELHMYSKGGHGFGMLKQNLPSDTWLARVYEWAVAEKLVTLPTTN